MKEVGIIQTKEVTEGTTDGKVWKRVAYQINNVIYSSFDTKIIDTFNTGDRVEMEYEKKGIFNNISKMELTEAAVTKPITETVEEPETSEVPQSVWDLKDKRITRMACLNSANALLANLSEETRNNVFNKNPPLDALEGLAEALYRWVYEK